MKSFLTPAVAILFTVLPIPAGEILLASFDLAGMPVETLPPTGSELRIQADDPAEGTRDRPADRAVYWQETKIGYIPARYRPQIEMLVRERIPMTLRVQSARPHPAPGQFLRVELWGIQRSAGENFPDFTQPEEPVYDWAWFAEE